MKTVMKKIFSLMLVAVLLVSAVPFQASAEEMIPLELEPGQYTVDDAFVSKYYTGEGTPIKYFVHNGGLMGETFTAIIERDYFLVIEEVATTPATLTCDTCKETYTEGTTHTCPTVTCDTCKETYTKGTAHTCPTVTCDTCKETYTKGTAHTCPSKPATYQVKFVYDNTSVVYNVEAGKSIKDTMKYDELKKVGDTDDRVFKGWSTDSEDTSGDSLSTVVRRDVKADVIYYAIFKNVAVDPPTSSNGNGITNKDNTNKVYLHVYLNGNASTIALTKDITSSYLLDDDKTSNGEIWTYLKNNYYSAKDGNVGLQIDGLYVSTGTQGTFPQNYYTDRKQADLTGIEALRDNGYVHINVMLKNAVAKGTYTADSSNPKTGDMIIAPVAVLGLSASALAVLFFLNKKRAY